MDPNCLVIDISIYMQQMTSADNIFGCIFSVTDKELEDRLNEKYFHVKSIFQYLAMGCGMIRGALANIGVNSVVTAEVSAMPACKFKVL